MTNTDARNRRCEKEKENKRRWTEIEEGREREISLTIVHVGWERGTR